MSRSTKRSSNPRASAQTTGPHPVKASQQEFPELPPEPYIDTDFVIASCDEKGHSVGLNVRIPPAYMRELEMVMDGKVFPYLSVTDIVRHAIDNQLRWLARIRGQEPSTVLSLLGLWNKQYAHAELVSKITGLLGSMRTFCSEQIDANRYDLVYDFLGMFRAAIDNLKEGNHKRELLDHWNNQLQSVFDRSRELMMRQLSNDVTLASEPPLRFPIASFELDSFIDEALIQ